MQLTISPIYALNNTGASPVPASGWSYDNSTVITGNTALGGAGGAVYVENLNITTIVCLE